MKKLLALLLILAGLLTILMSCGDDDGYYTPIASTEEEKTIVYTLSAEGKEYDVKYELYRAMFLLYKDTASWYNDNVWFGDDRDHYIEIAHSYTTERIAEIYATFAYANELGFDPYSEKVDTRVKKYIKSSVDEGYEGDYDAYLVELARNGLNYAVQDLLIRYYFCVDYIDSEMISKPNSDDDYEQFHFGKTAYTREDVENFYTSPDCVRIISAYFDLGILNAYEKASITLAEIKSATDIEEVKTAFARYASITIGELENGFVLGRHNSEYDNLTDAAFDLGYACVSEILTTFDGKLYIVYKLDKNTEHFENCYSEIVSAFLENLKGAQIDKYKDEMLSDQSIEALSNVDYLKLLGIAE